MCLLLISFPAIAETIQAVGVEIARSIDDLKGIDQVLDAASKQADTISFSVESLLNMGGDLLISGFVIGTYLLLCFARLFLLSFQHFYWLLLVALGPFLILAALFDATSGITKNAFKTMFQVACWPIIWSILSAYFKAIPFSEAYTSSEPLVTIATLNLIIAIALLFSPFIVTQLVDGVSLSVGDQLRRGALKAVMYANPKTLMAKAGATATFAGKSAETIRKFTPNRGVKPPWMY